MRLVDCSIEIGKRQSERLGNALGINNKEQYINNIDRNHIGSLGESQRGFEGRS